MSARSLVRSHPMASFFVLAYVLAWAWLPFGSFGAFSPLLAALVVVPMADGRAGLRRLAGRVLHWRVRWYWYLAAVAVPLGAIAGAAALTVALGAPAPALDQLHPWYGVPLAFAMAMVNPLAGPLGEEPGGSALLTLVGHAADSSVETSTFWSGADAGLMITLWCALLCCVAAVVLATDWRFWRGARPTPRMREPAVRLA